MVKSDMKRLMFLLEENLNITALESEVLQILLNADRNLTAKVIKANLQERGENVYRPLDSLVELGLIEEIQTWPKKYSAENFEQKLLDLINDKANKLAEIKSHITEAAENKSAIKPQIVKFFGNRTEYRNFREMQMQNVKKFFDLAVSGNPQNEHIKLVKRGVKVRCLVTNYRKKHENMYKLWQKNSIEVRKYGLKGLNLIIYDRRLVQLAMKEKPEKKEKSGIAFDNKILGRSFTDFFDKLWNDAREI
jgi:sugar-specific transcriptional regulator TrmB